MARGIVRYRKPIFDDVHKWPPWMGTTWLDPCSRPECNWAFIYDPRDMFYVFRHWPTDLPEHSTIESSIAVSTYNAYSFTRNTLRPSDPPIVWLILQQWLLHVHLYEAGLMLPMIGCNPVYEPERRR